jgi:hypothetical protein
MKYQHLNLVAVVHTVVVADNFYHFHADHLDYYHDNGLDNHFHLVVFVVVYNYHYIVVDSYFENHLHFVAGEILIDHHEIFLDK